MSRPVDWSPLRSEDPTPGDPGEVAALAARYRDTATAIRDQASSLSTLASQAEGGWKGKAGSVFHDHAHELSDRIVKAEQRYQRAGDALAAYAAAMTPAQADADRALRMAQDAQADLLANAPAPPAPAGSPPPTAADTAAEARRAANHADAQGRLASARRLVDAAEADYRSAAHRAASAISGAGHGDGLKDSWWDRNFHWVKDAVKWIGVAVMVIAVAALVVSLFVPGLQVLGGLVLADVLMDLATVGTAAMLVGHTALWATGRGSLTDVLIDVAVLATFGAAKGAGWLVKGAAESGQGIGSTVAAGRAGRAFMSAGGSAGALYSIAEHVPGAEAALRMFPSLDSALTGAQGAAAQARTAIAGLRVVEPDIAMTALAGGDLKLAESMTLLNRIDASVPDVVRIAMLRSGGAVTTGLIGAANYGNIAAAGYSNTVSFVTDPAREAAIEQSVEQITQRYRNPAISLP